LDLVVWDIGGGFIAFEEMGCMRQWEFNEIYQRG
jgi:hypothetical protein